MTIAVGDRGVYSVQRKVDTVIVQMDIDVAEQLVTILNEVSDETRRAEYAGSSMWVLRQKMVNDAEVRYPSPLYKATTLKSFLVLHDAL